MRLKVVVKVVSNFRELIQCEGERTRASIKALQEKGKIVIKQTGDGNIGEVSGGTVNQNFTKADKIYRKSTRLILVDRDF